MRSVLATLARPVARIPVPQTTRHTRTGPSLSTPTDAFTNMEAFGQLGTLWSVVTARAEAVAGPEWHLYRKPAPGTPPEDREEITSHLALDTWNQPTPFHDRTEFLKLWSMHRDLAGESFWFPSGPTALEGAPTQIWFARPDRMWPIVDTDEFLVGWEYRLAEHRIRYTAEQVHQFKLPNPLDPYRGLGPVQAMMTDVKTAVAAGTWNHNFFKNSAQPGGVIELPERLSDPEWEEFQDRWKAQHQGVENAHRVAVLERGAWKDRQLTMRDMEFAELRRLSDEQIRQALGMSKTMLGLTEDVNRATAETAEVVQARRYDLPRLKVLRRWLNTQYLPMFGVTTRGLEFDFDDPTPPDKQGEREDRDSRVQAVVDLIRAGAEPTSTAAAFGFDGIEWTDAGTGPSDVERAIADLRAAVSAQQQ